MSLHCMNPSCFSGDFGNPPDYQSDDPFICYGCGEVFDRDEECGGRDEDGNLLCHYCFEEEEEK